MLMREGLNETLSPSEIISGVEAIARVTDVSSLDEVENLASQTYETFQNCHLLFNNAGVLGPASLLARSSREMYDWLININLGGCFNGIHAFLPKDDSPLVRTLTSSQPVLLQALLPIRCWGFILHLNLAFGAS